MPLFLLLAVVTAAGLGLWIAALNVRYRDIRHVIPFALQLWPVRLPVGFSSDSSRAWRLLYSLNPMVGVIDGFRWAISAATRPRSTGLGGVGRVAVALLGGGLVVFPPHRADASPT